MKTNKIYKIAVVLFATAYLTGCSKPVLKPTGEDLMKVMSAMAESSTSLTIKEKEDANASPAGRKALLQKTCIDSFTKAGFDPDSSLQSFAKKWIEKDMTQDEAPYIKILLSAILEFTPELKEHALLAPETIALLEKVTI